jgi:hypothetical protein
LTSSSSRLRAIDQRSPGGGVGRARYSAPASALAIGASIGALAVRSR